MALRVGMGVGFGQETPAVWAELQEELSQQPLVVTGEIPRWLSGTLVRNGPINVEAGGERNDHWFDGLAMLHAFTFHDGKVRYSNRFLRTEAYRKVVEEGSIHYEGFACDPCRSWFKRFLTWFVPSGSKLPNANINVARLADQYVALHETPLPVRFDPQTLETLGVLNYQDKLPKGRCWESAHPHRDRTGNQHINYLIQFGRHSSYTLYAVPDEAPERRIIAEIPVGEPAYMHSFAVTEHYIVFAEYPFTVQPFDLMLRGKPFIKNFAWHPERGTSFLMVDRFTGQLKGRYQTRPFFAFHHANAYEMGDELVLDIVCYADPLFVGGLKGLHLPSDMRLERFTLSLKSGTVTSEVLLKEMVEFPRLNETFDGRPYRYLYLADTREDGQPRPLFKFDTETKSSLTWSEKGGEPGEPVFVAAPHATEEDEGVVLALVLESSRNSSFLLVLDAKTFKELGRATASHRIPAGLHGQFF